MDVRPLMLSQVAAATDSAADSDLRARIGKSAMNTKLSRPLVLMTAYLGCASGFAPAFTRAANRILRASALERPDVPACARHRTFLRMLSAPAHLGQNLGELFDTYLEPDASFFTAKGGVNPVLSGKSLPRKQVHATGTWHRAVHIWLYNSKGQILLQKRCKPTTYFTVSFTCDDFCICLHKYIFVVRSVSSFC